MEEDEIQAENPIFQEESPKRKTGSMENQTVHAEVAKLLQYCSDEKHAGESGRLDVPQNPYVHMEDVEETKIENEISRKIRRAGENAIPGHGQGDKIQSGGLHHKVGLSARY